jgi:hypothetical protein
MNYANSIRVIGVISGSTLHINFNFKRAVIDRAYSLRRKTMIQSKFVYQVLVILMLLLTAACGTHYVIRPGALNAGDSAAYDTLLIAESVIDQARSAVQAGAISSSQAKDALNSAVQSYNVARDSWLTYRGAIATNVPFDSYFQQLTKNLTDLTNAIQGLKEVKK